MKKMLLLALLFSALCSTSAQAQAPAAVDQTAMLQQMKEKFKMPMVEKTGLTEAQVDKVLEINLEIRMMSTGFRELSEADRAAKVAELKVLKDKKYSEIPLTPEQIKSVHAFFADMGSSGTRKVAN